MGSERHWAPRCCELDTSANEQEDSSHFLGVVGAAAFASAASITAAFSFSSSLRGRFHPAAVVCLARVSADSNRRHQHAAGTDEGAVLDDGRPLVLAIVVAGNAAGPYVDAAAHPGVAQI